MLTCDQALLLISASLDGPLTAADQALLDAHLTQCEDCRAILADFQAMHSALSTPTVQPPADLKDSIMTRVREMKIVPLPSKAGRVWGRKTWGSLVAVLAVVILGAGGLRLLGIPVIPQGTAITPTAAVNAPQPALFQGEEDVSDVPVPVETPRQPSAPASGREADAPAVNAASVPVGNTPAPRTAPAAEGPVSPALTAEEKASPAPTVEEKVSPAPMPNAVTGFSIAPETSDQPLAPRCTLTTPAPDAVYLAIVVLSDTADLQLERFPYQQVDCELHYTVPAADFQTLLTQVEGRADVTLTQVGTGLSPDAEYGMVIVVPAD